MPQEWRNPAFGRMISDFVRLRAKDLLPPRDVERLRAYLVDCFLTGEPPPSRGTRIDWAGLATAAQIDVELLDGARTALRPGIEALRRELKKPPRRPPTPRTPRAEAVRESPRLTTTEAAPPRADRPPRKRGRPPKQRPPVETRPEPRELTWVEAETFHEALDLHIERHGDTIRSLAEALVQQGCYVETSTLRMWRRGLKAPAYRDSFEILAKLEERWRLPAGYFRQKLPHPGRAPRGQHVGGISTAERRRLAWHLPDDFDRRRVTEQEEILEWVRRVVVAGSTDYRRYQALAARQPFGLRFRSLEAQMLGRVRLRSGSPVASPELEAEMQALLAFKTATLSPFGYQRRGVWGPETASQRVEHLGLLFGTLAASPTGPVRGLGIPSEAICFGLLIFPQIWDWYLAWREGRRGFFTAWEVDMLNVAVALTAPETGWIAQTPALAERLVAIHGVVTQEDIDRARADWPGACATMHRQALARSQEIARVSRVHRDPFEAILPVLESDSPVGAYRRIADEIVRLRPCSRLYPKAAAESSRALLMIRFGLHLGFRQKNLRQLLVCPPGHLPRSERQLTDLRRGELRWNAREQGWEVFVPSAAFKNSGSSFFAGRPFRLILPDVHHLYAEIDAYLERHRQVLLGGARDPGAFFIKTVKISSREAAYDQNTFYEAWRWIIQRYGIHNPWTGRGAIEGLLPHGPHNVRDVLATHILKQTGSYEQASYAIQDTPETVAAHYGRFLPQDKAAIAAQVLNRAWETV